MNTNGPKELAIQRSKVVKNNLILACEEKNKRQYPGLFRSVDLRDCVSKVSISREALDDGRIIDMFRPWM